MDPRGLTTLALGAALMLSPVAYWLISDPEPVSAAVETVAPEAIAAPGEPSEPGQAQSDPAAEPECTAAAIVTTSNRVDCNGETTKVATRRVTSGGAVFVQVGD